MSISKDTVSRGIHEMSTEIEKEVIYSIKCTWCYAIQLEETLNFVQLAASLIAALYINKNSVEDEMLFCKPSKTRTTGKHIFNLVEFYLKEDCLPWEKCADICTSGAKSMTGKYCVFIACFKNILPEIGIRCCITHGHALVVKKIVTWCFKMSSVGVWK